MKALTILFPLVNFFLHSYMMLLGLLLVRQAKPKLLVPIGRGIV